MPALKDAVENIVKTQIADALTGGALSTEDVAQRLGVHKTTAWRYMKRLGYLFTVKDKKWHKSKAPR